jgi:hypothetical protein
LDVDGDVDEDDIELATLCKFEHRKNLPYRASKHNAADAYFQSSTSLVYHYLDYIPNSVVLGDFNSLEKITLLCGFCNRAGRTGMKGWNVNGRGRGSTTNYSNHMKAHHTKAWDDITALDVAGIGGGDVNVAADENGGLQKWLSEKVRFYLFTS